MRRWRSQLQRFAAALALLALAACAARQPSPPPPAPPAPAPAALPWTTAIGALQNLSNNQTCTATLIAQDVIVTAAHCLAGGTPQFGGREFVFLPNEGTAPNFPPLRILGIQAVGQSVQQGVIDGSQASGDWALLRVETAPPALHPVAVNAMRLDQIQARLAAGDHFFSGGYGTPGLLQFTQHQNCQPVDPSGLGVYLDDGLIATDCMVRPRDSGGPLVLVDIAGRPHLIAVISGIGRPNSDHPFGVGVEALHFQPYLKGVPISFRDPAGTLAPAG